MANQFIIRPAPRQNFEAFVRYVVGLAEGARVETDTSGSPYFVRVDEGTYRRWTAALPKKPAAAEAPAVSGAGAASASVEESAPAAPAPAEAAPVREPQPEPEPPKPVAKRAKSRTAGASRKRSTGGN